MKSVTFVLYIHKAWLPMTCRIKCTSDVYMVLKNCLYSFMHILSSLSMVVPYLVCRQLWNAPYGIKYSQVQTAFFCRDHWVSLKVRFCCSSFAKFLKSVRITVLRDIKTIYIAYIEPQQRIHYYRTIKEAACQFKTKEELHWQILVHMGTGTRLRTITIRSKPLLHSPEKSLTLFSFVFVEFFLN